MSDEAWFCVGLVTVVLVMNVFFIALMFGCSKSQSPEACNDEENQSLLQHEEKTEIDKES